MSTTTEPPDRPTHVPSAIPTLYRGVMMRSRLEARWAAAFDALGWVWRYEPTDLSGYIPDFVLDFGAAPVVAEVKGVPRLSDLRPHAERIVAAGWRGEFLVLGETVFRGNTLGMFGDDHACSAGGEVELDLGVLFFCISCGQLSLRSENLSHRCRRCGARDGHVGELGGDFGQPTLEDIWKAAGNRVQWRPR